MSASAKVILIAGSSRGLGQGLTQAMAKLNEPIRLIAASRSGRPDESIKLAHPDSTVDYAELDYTLDSTITALVNYVKEQYGKLDLLYNVGGILGEGDEPIPSSLIASILNTNVRGPLKLTTALIPLIPVGGRVVNFSSVMSKQFNPPSDIKAALTDPKLTLQELNNLLDEYQADISKNDPTSKWYLKALYPVYSTSKAFVNFWTTVVARDNPGILINGCCPGLVATEGTVNIPGGMPIDKGVRVPLQVGLDDIGKITGKFWAAPTALDQTSPGIVNDDWLGAGM